MPRERVELFFSYSHKDRELCEELERHLSVLKRQGVISVWHDRKITAGTEWAGAIDAHLNTARIILLLVSADFVSSDYCYDVEITRALARHAADEARVIPVLLRAVDWRGAPFSHLQAVPTGAVPVTSWDNRDEAFADVARAIREAIVELAAQPARGDDAPAGFSPVDRSALYFPSQPQLVEEQARYVVGRAYVEAALERFTSTHPCGYFIIEGGPGLGKTAIAARLTGQRAAVRHFIGRTERRSDVRLILSSLIVQLEQTATPASLATVSMDDLSARFTSALRHRARPASGLLLVIDALNELVEDAEPVFLPTETLPTGVHFVVTSQPGERLMRLVEQLATVPTQVYQLGPLEPTEMRDLILSRQPDATDAVIERVEQASLGNPLYIRATMDALSLGADFDAKMLPKAVEGYFGRATRALPHNPLLRDVLGFLGTSRKSLRLLELSQLTGSAQRVLDTEAIRLIRPFLLQMEEGYAFYHERFHDFVVRELLYEDELRGYHRRLAEWLVSPSVKGGDYYWTSLTYHLFHSGDASALQGIDDQFLSEKLRRFGYSVLEDLELLAAATLSTGDPSSLEQCVGRLQALRQIVGTGIVDEVARSVQPNLRGPHTRSVVPRFSVVPGIDAYGVLLPKREVTADFVEVVPRNDHLVIAIGDAPMSGLKSAFVARFIATLFRSLVLAPGSVRLDDVVNRLSSLVSRHPYFERVSMQCVDIALDQGTMTMVNAGHPYPVLYSPRYGRCDRLAVRGPLLHAGELQAGRSGSYRVRHAEVGDGCIVVLVSDGITEGGPVNDPYGYRFTSVIERKAGSTAKSICEAILADWRRHQIGDVATDDATILVLVLTGKPLNQVDAD